jgi:hypothetical protein
MHGRNPMSLEELAISCTQLEQGEENVKLTNRVEATFFFG